MSQREAAEHWSSDKVYQRRNEAWKKRKSPNRTTPYIMSMRLGDEEIDIMDFMRENLKEMDDSTDWGINSFLIRRMFRYSKAYMLTLIDQKKEKEQKKLEGQQQHQEGVV
jgi:hypothetical protein